MIVLTKGVGDMGFQISAVTHDFGSAAKQIASGPHRF
jgi:hypothetical protein